jgi:hypothetical protein
MDVVPKDLSDSQKTKRKQVISEVLDRMENDAKSFDHCSHLRQNLTYSVQINFRISENSKAVISIKQIRNMMFLLFDVREIFMV